MAGGYLIEPQVYFTTSQSAPPGWKYTGIITAFSVENLTEWDNGQITNIRDFSNHTAMDICGPVDNLCVPAFAVRVKHDLYTAAEMESYELNGDTPQSDYWYIFMARQGEEFGYAISLCAEIYSLDDAVMLAESISF